MRFLPFFAGPLTTSQEPLNASVGLLYACQLCSLRFGNLPALQQHTLSAHSLADVLRLYCPPPPLDIKTDVAAQSFPTDLSCPKRRQDLSPVVDPRYCCPHCPSEFGSSETGTFSAHLAGHLVSSWSEYGCSSCPTKTFQTPDELQKHLLDVHAHHIYRCALCQEIFDSKVGIQVHLAVQHSNESKMYRCTACPPVADVFRTEADFHAHVAANHLPVAVAVSKQPVPAPALLSLLKCPLCPLSFPVEFLLERHIHLNHQDQISLPASKPEKVAVVENVSETSSSSAATVLNLSLHCAYCGETCKSRSDLESHMKTAHAPAGTTPSAAATAANASSCGSGRIKCNICDELFPSASILAEHKLSHCKVSGAAVCAQCRIPLPTEEAYYAHLQSPPHGPNSGTPPLTCLVCRQTLNLPLEVGLHARFHTSGANKPVPPTELYPCSFCHRQLESTQLVASGMAPGSGMQQTYACKDCLHHQQQQPRRFQCIKCQEIFSNEAEIQAHVAGHLMSEGCLHPCRLCARQFDTPLKLQAHLIEHTFAGCPAFACYLCGCLFTAAINLQRHMFDQHGDATALRPYDCSLCHHKFFFRAELDNHLLSHAQQQSAEIQETESAVDKKEEEESQEKIDVVEESDQMNTNEDEEDMDDDEDDNISVTSSSHSSEITLSDAQKAANAIPEGITSSEERNGNMSDSSESSSSSSSSVKEHQQQSIESSGGNNTSSTSPFRCDRCDQSFPCLSNLQGHVRIHTQSRRFTCPEASCGKEFALRRNLHIHMRSHTGDRPYSCPICQKRFARKENRKAHLKLHSGVKPFRCDICAKAFARKSHLVEHGRTHSSSATESVANVVAKSDSEPAVTSVPIDSSSQSAKLENQPK